MVKSFRNACGDDMTQTILLTNKCFRPCSSDFSPLVPGYEIRVVLLSSFVINKEISIQQVICYKQKELWALVRNCYKVQSAINN